jgi:cytidylate kinase
MTPRVIAIDGPAASGKSTTAAAVARELGALHLDSGALYRGLTAVALELAPRDAAVILGAAEARGLALRQAGEEVIPYLDGRPAEDRIRGSEVTRLVSEVSALPDVRVWVNARLREAVSQRTLVVMDGRDIGTAVFPDAPVKVFLTATPEARARRRLLQRGERPSQAEIASEAAALAERDRKDSSRVVAPLQKAPDATLLDTTTLSFEEQVGEIVRLARGRLPQA